MKLDPVNWIERNIFCLSERLGGGHDSVKTLGFQDVVIRGFIED